MDKKRAESLYNTILTSVVEPIVGDGITYMDQLEADGGYFLGDKFAGVFASDTIPVLTKDTPYAIINLDESTGRGSHWVAVAKIFGKKVKKQLMDDTHDTTAVSRKNGGLMLYDSFGRKGSDILPSVEHSGNGGIHDTDLDAEQVAIEYNCGARSLAWLLLFEHWGSKLAKHI